MEWHAPAPGRPRPPLWNRHGFPAMVQETWHLSLLFPDLKNLTPLRSNPSEDPAPSEGLMVGVFEKFNTSQDFFTACNDIQQNA